MAIPAGTDVLDHANEDALIAYLKMTMGLTDNGEVFMRALHRLAQQVTRGVIVELGAYVGRSAIALAWEASVPVYSIDDYADHIDWSGKHYGAENEEAYRHNILAADVSTTLIVKDAQQAAREWDKPIGLLLWDISESNRLYDDWIAWRKFIVVNGHAVLRDTFDRRLGSDRIIAHEREQHEFVIESQQPGLLTLRRYAR